MDYPGIGHIQITENKIIVVEGKEDYRFFQALSRNLSLSGIQILPIGAKTTLRRNLQLLAKDADFISKVQLLAIIRDANSNSTSVFQSVCGALKKAKLPVPSAVLIPTSTIPVVKVLLIPPGLSSGKLEDVCLQSVSTDAATPCVNSYFSCLTSLSGFTMPQDLSKAKVHAFLSSRRNPALRLGEAAEAGIWSFNNTVFDPIKSFLLSL